ncbi:LPXTG cell wall anchor domain-containing protein [Aquimarina sp. MMG016]|uniref:LPXTG cell wall anchor domain-containing protein n=1 Tax=Aquimarina sp. MMG016 TaxID=2822690 RepID=UPI001B3A2B6B|nr:LPXTG cell wall anchor domain-containing protein [Aquimarina sp. MMG016]MBQ4820176.1 LPXTG cell wall anchor domain-containing protein [Aquimarina sp. MMG016]
MKNYELRSKNKAYVTPLKVVRGMFFIISLFLLFAEEGLAQVTATIDSTSIEIGEEIRYKMQVEADSTEIVVFPEGQTFSPLEVIESYTTDTTKNGNRFSLIKEYALTQFDSGQYTIPRQKIAIGERVFFTDSMKVEVRDVLVDTTKQKMYEIKPLVEVDAPLVINWKKWLLWIGIPLLILGLIAFFILRRKKKKAAKEEELPPYERAMLALQKIDESHLLEQDSHKEYYSQLSDTARKYIDEEVYDHAMESTTDELIERLDEEIRSGSLNLDKHTIDELKTVLKTADMAKFAKSKPDIGTAKADRSVIERVINETKEAIPEPTEEELLADEEYRRTAALKKQRKKIIFGSIAGVGVIAITLGIFIIIKGYDLVKDTLLGHPTKELAETEWISSAYGSPSVTISTPKVLIRNNFKLTEEQKQILKGNETFVYGSILSNFYVVVTTMSYQKETKVDLEKAVEGVVGYLEGQGGKNITVKNEEYQTLGGAKGIKVFGNFDVKNPIDKYNKKCEYMMLNFGEKGGFQQITVIYDIEDRYAKDVAQRIINSVELRTTK